MGINLDYPSIAAADEIGLFREYDKDHGYPPDGDSWARSVIAKFYESNESASRPGRGSELGMNGFNPTEEELAVWKWYQDQTERKNWDRHVNEHLAAEAKEGAEPPDKFDPNKEYIDTPKIDVKAPDVKPFGGGSGGAGAISVSTEAILHFANALRAVEPNGGGGMLGTAVTTLQKAELSPGAFGKAVKLQLDLTGDGGLRGATVNVLMQIQAIFGILENDLQKLIKNYDSAEELNTLSVDKLNETMDDSTPRINRLGDQPEKEKGAD